MKHLVRAALAAAVLALAAPACAPAQEAKPYLNGGKPQHLATEALTIRTAKGPRRFTVQVADDEPKRELGLMYVRRMADDQGMIFDFPQPGPQAFWMKDTFIPLDIIYVSPDGRVLSIAKRAKPHDESPLPSGGIARGVIEINGGLADRLGIRPGDRVVDAKVFPQP